MRGFLMMALALFAASALAAPPVHKAAPHTPVESPLPAFDFKGYVAGATIDPSPLGTCRAPAASGEVQCEPTNGSVAGITNVLPPEIFLYQGRMTTMVYVFRADDYATVLLAMNAKYGKPCANAVDKWQSKAGATFDNPQTIWCFKTGRLTLEAMSTDKTYGDLIYTDTWSAPTSAPKVDF